LNDILPEALKDFTYHFSKLLCWKGFVYVANKPRLEPRLVCEPHPELFGSGDCVERLAMSVNVERWHFSSFLVL
jgi:hypothetical protein